MDELLTIVIYDIPDDKARLRIIEACKDFGLLRFQYSAFQGDLGRNKREELIVRLRRSLGEKAGRISIFPMCAKDLKSRVDILVEEIEEYQCSEGSNGCEE
jgi:CRISPR-associated protein Cas2